MERWWRVTVAALIVLVVGIAVWLFDPGSSDEIVALPRTTQAATQAKADQAEQATKPQAEAEEPQPSADAPQSEEAQPAPIEEPEPPWRQDDRAALASLTVEPEDSGGIAYSREDYDIYGGRDENGCNVRDLVILRDAVRIVSVDDDCNAVGEWYSWLDGKTIHDEAELQIDHLVSLSEAHDSGAWRWDVERRKAFNNDLGHPKTLSAVSKEVNGKKWAYDPGEWRPPLRSSWCRFARDWISVKLTWELTADEAEVDALAEMLDTCAEPP